MFDELEKTDRAQAAQTNPVTLAFLGDAVYSLYVREKLVKNGGGKSADFQRAASKIESARGQSVFLDKLLPTFTEEETGIYKRGRNAKKATKSKHASVAEYARSTGFEAVLGFLYLVGDFARIRELLSTIDENDLQGVGAETPFKP